MRGKLMLYLDQWGNRWFARTVAELCEQVGRQRVAKMYRDRKDGSTCHVGYVVGQHWCEAFEPVRRPA